MPINYKLYPPNWKTEIVPAIKERDGHRCKFCGVENYAVVAKLVENGTNRQVVDRPPFTEFRKIDTVTNPKNPSDYTIARRIARLMDCDSLIIHSVIVLTVAHLDHDTTNNDYSNLAALCQKCHLRYDKDHHSKNSKATNAAKKAATEAKMGVLKLF